MEASPLIPERDASRHINLWRKVTGPLAPKVIDRLDEVQIEVEQSEERRARSAGDAERFRQCLRGICIDLFYAYKLSPKQQVGVHRGNSKLTQNAIYPMFVTARIFLDALDGLEAMGYLETLSLGTEASGRTTRIRATQKLVVKLDVFGVRNTDIIDTDDLIRVNIGQKTDKRRVKFEETEQTELWRRNLRRINEHNAKYLIDLDFRNFREEFGRDRLFTDRDEKETRLRTDFDAIRLYRVFNSLDFNTGGRFYGGWWINLKSEFRKFITINNKDTCEHDFSYIHPMLLYAEKGVELGAAYDPYTAPHGASLRSEVKEAFNIMINGKRRPTQDKVPNFDKHKAGMSWMHFLDGIIETHKPIADQFFSGAGSRLQRQDSDIAEAILLEFVSMGQPCLPIHDSIITYQTLDDEVPEIMQRIVKALLGVHSQTKRKDSISYRDSVVPGAVEMSIEEILESMSEREFNWSG